MDAKITGKLTVDEKELTCYHEVYSTLEAIMHRAEYIRKNPGSEYIEEFSANIERLALGILALIKEHQTTVLKIVTQGQTSPAGDRAFEFWWEGEKDVYQDCANYDDVWLSVMKVLTVRGDNMMTGALFNQFTIEAVALEIAKRVEKKNESTTEKV